jgi:hypothetical protein
MGKLKYKNKQFSWQNLWNHNVLTNLGHHFEAVHLFGSDDSCQGLIWDNHLSVERVLEVVVPDVDPDKPYNLLHGGSLHTDDCHQVLVNLQLSSQGLVAGVAVPILPSHSLVLVFFDGPVGNCAPEGLRFDDVIAIVDVPSTIASLLTFWLHFVIFLRLKYRKACFVIKAEDAMTWSCHFPETVPELRE